MMRQPDRRSGAGLMSAVNFFLHSDFRWLLVLPLIGWAAAVLLYLAKRPVGAAA